MAKAQYNDEYIFSLMEDVSISLKGKDAKLHEEVEIAEEKLMASLSKEQKSLFINYDFKQNTRQTREFELYFIEGFKRGQKNKGISNESN